MKLWGKAILTQPQGEKNTKNLKLVLAAPLRLNLCQCIPELGDVWIVEEVILGIRANSIAFSTQGSCNELKLPEDWRQ